MMKEQPKLILNGRKNNQLPRRRGGDKETRRQGEFFIAYLLSIP